MRFLAAFVTLVGAAVIGVRVGNLVVTTRGVLSVPMSLPGAIVVMAKRSAVRRNRGDALDRQGQGQQHDGKNAEKSSRHWRHCTSVALSLTRGSGSPARRISCGCNRTLLKHPTVIVMPATNAPTSATHHGEQRQMMAHHYGRLLVMTVLSFAAMYGLMYAMVDRLDNVYNNVNQVYMAGLMAAAMVVIELAVMGAMYQSRKLNAIIITLSIIALAACWALIRAQGGVGERQFLRSMIPHHAGAILMCEKAPLHDPEIKELCKNIITGQEAEIRQMKAKLAELAQ